jgi:hypothetical protein
VPATEFGLIFGVAGLHFPGSPRLRSGGAPGSPQRTPPAALPSNPVRRASFWASDSFAQKVHKTLAAVSLLINFQQPGKEAGKTKLEIREVRL